jgi:hypothetical protein
MTLATRDLANVRPWIGPSGLSQARQEPRGRARIRAAVGLHLAECGLDRDTLTIPELGRSGLGWLERLRHQLDKGSVPESILGLRGTGPQQRAKRLLTLGTRPGKKGASANPGAASKALTADRRTLLEESACDLHHMRNPLTVMESTIRSLDRQWVVIRWSSKCFQGHRIRMSSVCRGIGRS